MSRNYMSKNEELRRGDTLMANNKNYKAVFQNDGNFCIYGWQPLWHTNTAGDRSFRVCLKPNCDLVVSDSEDKVLWSSGSAGAKCKMCHLQLSDEGKLLLYGEGKVLWESKSDK